MRFRIVAAVLSLVGILATRATAAERPNVLVILADDQGWGDLSLHGNTNLKTPRIDAIAREGARFSRFFVQPVCAPTRAEFLTGRFHPRGGVSGVSMGAERLDLDETTVAQAFRSAGYATALFGKWHNGSQYPYHPRARGFDRYYGFTSGHWGEYFDPLLDIDGEPTRGKGYLPDDLTTHALDFMQANVKDRRPFFCYVAYNTPHSPMQVPDAEYARFEGKPLALKGGPQENVPHTRAALAMCENLDANVGRLLDSLKGQGIDRETIVVYFSDNGPNGHRWNGGMRGIKGTTDDGGTRSPLLVRYPAAVAPGTVVPALAGAVDLYPTLIDLAGIPRAGDKPFDGISLASWLRRGSEDARRKASDRVLYQYWSASLGVRDARYRLDDKGRLYDLDADVGQTKDLSSTLPDVKKKLSDAAAWYRKTVLSERPIVDNRPFPVGHSAMPRAFLPARDGVPANDIKRSANAPNCSYFTNWTNRFDRMTWPIAVAEPGRYEAIVHYTCAPGDVGSTIELSLNDAKWTGTIAKAHDPPLRGAERDRVPRKGESYVKDFRPLSLGTIDLPKSEGTLILRALKVAGKSVADVRAVELRKK